MNHAIHMHPCWGATEGPGMHRNSMQNWQPEPPASGVGGPHGGSMTDETFSPVMAETQGSGSERRRGGGGGRGSGRGDGGSGRGDGSGGGGGRGDGRGGGGSGRGDGSGGGGGRGDGRGGGGRGDGSGGGGGGGGGGGKRNRHGRHFGGPRMDWNEDAVGPMFGPGGPFRGQRGRRGRRNRGDVRASVLLLLDERPRHGYEILTELADRSDGSWRPSPGSIYPVLKTLTEEGLVQPEQEAGRRVFHLTDEGRKFVNEHRESWGEPWQTDSSTTSPGLDGLHQEARQLFGAVRQVVDGGDEDQLRQTAATLARARKAIYLMLADVDASVDVARTSAADRSPDEKTLLEEEQSSEAVEAPEAALDPEG